MSKCKYCGANTFGPVCAKCQKNPLKKIKVLSITEAIDALYQKGYDITIKTIRSSGVSNIITIIVEKADIVEQRYDHGHLPGLKEEVLRATLNNIWRDYKRHGKI